ncbi:MAG: CPBP family intramembrane glutamic endopeptidase [Anaerolineales bacterium]
MLKIKHWIKDHHIAAFFIITYLITWGLMFPFARLHFQKDSILATIPLGWGLFGPALAGIIITRVISPEKEKEGRKGPPLAFFLGLILSAAVFLGNIYFQDNIEWTVVILILAILLALIIAIPPAFVVSSAFSKNRTVKGYLESLIKPQGSFVYYLVALFLPLLSYWAGALITKWLDLIPYYSPTPLSGWIGFRTLGMAFFYQFFFANVLGEEVGWRGFALPRMQARINPLFASLIIAAFWFPWHLPLKLGNPDIIPMLFYALSFIPTSILLTWIYNRTKGSILAVGIAHIAGNLGGKFLFPITDARLAVGFVVALILILLDRMWEKLPANHPAVYQPREFEENKLSNSLNVWKVTSSL